VETMIGRGFREQNSALPGPVVRRTVSTLVNAETASASEILGWGLQDEAASVAGSRTSAKVRSRTLIAGCGAGLPLPWRAT